MSDTTNKVQAIIADKLGVDVEEVVAGATFEALGADSLDMVEVTMELEQEFSISVSDEEAGAVKSVQDVFDIVAAKV
jgi:acyl carrier protein